MTRLSWKLVKWSLSRNKYRLLLTILTMVGSITTYSIMGAVLDEMAIKAVGSWRTTPFDITVVGELPAGVLKQAGAIAGIRHIEQASMAKAGIGARELDFLAPSEETRMHMVCQDGRLPEGPNEVALPESLAAALRLSVGQELHVLLTERNLQAATLQVSGVIEDNARAPSMPIVTAKGAAQLALRPNGALLVLLDGRSELEPIVTALARLVPRSDIYSDSVQYQSLMQGVSLAGMMVSSMRGLILIISASALGVLIYLGQRERAYQTGVLRAMGLRQSMLIAAPLAEGCITFAASGLIAVPVLQLVMPMLGIDLAAVDIAAKAIAQLLLFAGIGLAVIFFTSRAFVGQKITQLLNDDWAKA